MNPRFRSIPGYNGYEISETGEVRSWLKSGPMGNGLAEEPRVLSPNIISFTPTYLLRNPEGGYDRVTVGYLLLITFDREPEKGETVRYQDKQDIRIETVSWQSAEADMLDDLIRHGLSLGAGWRRESRRIVSDRGDKLWILAAGGQRYVHITRTLKGSEGPMEVKCLGPYQSRGWRERLIADANNYMHDHPGGYPREKEQSTDADPR